MQDNVAPLAGAWIEIYVISGRSHPASVAPLAGAWIEIVASAIVETFAIVAPICLSTRGSVVFNHVGTHFISSWRLVAPLAGAWIEILPVQKSITPCRVAPLAGAWIEISVQNPLSVFCFVAPLAGAWIEIDRIFVDILYATSLPSRERGLKYKMEVQNIAKAKVAPLAGAWIEILYLIWTIPRDFSRSPRGSVD